MNKDKLSNIKIFEYTKIVGIENIKFGENVIIDDFVFIYAKQKINIGNYVHIAVGASITGGEELVVNDFAAISQGVRILTATDDFKSWGFGNSTIDNRFRNVKFGKIHIGKFCIIGANSVVLPGVTIGEGAVVGANSVVTKNLDPWGVYIGNKRVAERNKKAVIKNFESFQEFSQEEKVGTIFKV